MVAETKIGVGGAWKGMNSIQVGVGGAWKTVSEAYVGVGGAWKLVHQNAAAPSSVSITGGTVTCIVETSGGSCTSSTALIPTINGGSGGSYTYAWTLVSGSGLTNSSTSGSTLTLSKTSDPPAGGYNSSTESWKVTVTNPGGATVSNTVSVTLRSYGDFDD
jgi:hypothetical protein